MQTIFVNLPRYYSSYFACRRRRQEITSNILHWSWFRLFVFFSHYLLWTFARSFWWHRHVLPHDAILQLRCSPLLWTESCRLLSVWFQTSSRWPRHVSMEDSSRCHYRQQRCRAVCQKTPPIGRLTTLSAAILYFVRIFSGYSSASVVCNPAHHWARPKPGKRGELASGRASGRKRSAPNPQAWRIKSWDECVRQDLKSLGLKKEWALERTSWRNLIGGKRPTCA